MRKQQGMTFIGTLFTIIVLVMVAIIAMRVIPVYMQYYSLIESIKGLNTLPSSSLTGDSEQDIMVLKSNLDKRLNINGVASLSENQLTVIANGVNKFQVHLKYQVTKPLISNVSLLFNFNHTEEVTASSEH